VTDLSPARVTVMGTSTELSAATTPMSVVSAVNVYSGSVGRSSVTFMAAIKPWLVIVTLNVPTWPGASVGMDGGALMVTTGAGTLVVKSVCNWICIYRGWWSATPPTSSSRTGGR